MKLKFLLPILCIALLLSACGGEVQEDPASSVESSAPAEDTLPAEDMPAAAVPPPVPEDDSTFVRVADYIPEILVDLKYAADTNFTGEVIYEFHDAYLRYGTVKKLAAAAEQVAQDGYRLMIWDAFRPTSAQFKLWEICPDPVYVANPNNGFSSHSRGNTVDITLAREDGSLVEMPTGFDDFSTLADRDYSDVSEPAATNVRYLENVMVSQGFKPYSGEWWHFSDEVSYEVEDEFIPPAS